MTFHLAGPTDSQRDVRCALCGVVLAPAVVWTHSETGAEMRVPMGLRPAEGQIVAMRGDRPYFGQYRAPQGTQPNCAAVQKAVA